MTESAARAAFKNGTVVRWRNPDRSMDARKMRDGHITALTSVDVGRGLFVARVRPCGVDGISDYVRISNLSA